MSAWKKAVGSCGFGAAKKGVEATYLNGVAIFAFESILSKAKKPLFTSIIVGQGSLNGASIDAVKADAEKIANGRRHGKFGISEVQFNEMIAAKTRAAPAAKAAA